MKINGLLLSVLAVGIIVFGLLGRGYWHPVYTKVMGKRTVSDVVSQYGEHARARLNADFENAGVPYPPKKVTFLAVKDTQILEVWASDETSWKKIKHYTIQAASGVSGPKLKEGDRQVPEGIYKIIGLNPNSAYHLSMKLNYPNDFDLTHAKNENRLEPGSNIFIHGKAVSIGCLAMGDTAIEELFILGADVGIGNIRVMIAPTDPRTQPLVPPEGAQPWVSELYENIAKGFSPYVTH